MRDDPQITALVARYLPAIAQDIALARTRVASLFPRRHELVYDNYNALVFGFSPTLRPSDAIVSVVGYPKWVTLFFLKGAGLNDPKKLLQGTGSTVRSIRLQPITVLEEESVVGLLIQAIAQHAPAFAVAPKLTTEIRFVSEKQRPRRPSTEAIPPRKTKFRQRSNPDDA